MNDWIEWKGGKQPVADGVITRIQMRCEDDDEADGPAEDRPAQVWRWYHTGDDSDIIAYKIVESGE